MAAKIDPNSIPNNIQNSTVLVEEYQYKDPKSLNTFGTANVDSLKQATGFTYKADQLYTQDQPMQEHPLLVETNKHLNSYNKGLLKTMDYYKFPFTVVNDNNLVVMNYEMQGADENGGMIGGENDATVATQACNADLGQYQYALVRRPVPHCYIDPNNVAQESYRYEYYFQNLQTGETYPAIDVYAANPNKTLKAIIYKINKSGVNNNATAQNTAESE
jgi:hypothetical protein